MVISPEDRQDKEELKRADHLLFVTLKYTRTTDVIKNTVKMLISSMEFSIKYILESLKEKGRIETVPLTPVSKAELLKSTFKRNKELQDYLKFYFFLKEIDRAEYEKKEEFRKHVTLTALIGDKRIDIDIVKLHEYFDKTNEFVKFVDENFLE